MAKVTRLLESGTEIDSTDEVSKILAKINTISTIRWAVRMHLSIFS